MTTLNRLALWRAGARSVHIYPGKEVPIAGLDGLVVGGGDDIDVELYNRELVLDTRIDPERDKLEMRALDAAMKNGLPVLGICRGSQILNVFFGGTLHTDIHEIYEKAPRMRTILPRKTIHTVPGSRLHDILDCGSCRVNSLHHQSIDKTGRGLTVVARDEHDIIQGVENPDAPFLMGVQWHPEFLVLNRGQQSLFRELVAAAVGGSSGPRAHAVASQGRQ